MTATGKEAVMLKQLKSAFGEEGGDINLDSTVTGDEAVTLKQLKMLRDSLAAAILGQFSDELDTIIGGDTTPVTDITARLATVNGVSGDVNAQLDTLDGTKSAIKDAIVAKGVKVPEGTVFRDYATKIGEIETGGEQGSVQVSYGGNSDANFYFVDAEGIYQSLKNPSSIAVSLPAIIGIYANPREPMYGNNASVDSVSGGSVLARGNFGGLVKNLICVVCITESVASISIN